MPGATVLIVANPIEARVIGRVVDGAGLRAVVAEGGEGALGRLADEAPQVVVLARGLYGGHDEAILAAAMARSPRPRVILVGDGSEPTPPAASGGSSPGSSLPPDLVLGRPIDPGQLAEALRAMAPPPAGSGSRAPSRPPSASSSSAPSEDPLASLRDAFGGPLRAAAPRTPTLRLDEALGAEAIGRPVPATRVPLEERVTSAERRMQSRPGAIEDLTLAGTSTGPMVPVADGASRAPALPGRPGVDAALARLVPGREAALRRGAISSAAPLPELDEAGRGDLPDSGDLQRSPVPELLVRLHRGGFTGRLVLRRGDAEKSIFFDGGFPVHAVSSLPHDSLGELLWREGKMTRDQEARGRQLAERSGRRLVDALIEIGALKRDELFRVLRHLAEEIIYSCFAWDRGSYALGREAARRVDRVSVAHPYALVIEGVRRKFALERLVELVGSERTLLAAAPMMWRLCADAGLSAGERDGLQLLRRGARTLGELRTAGRLDEIGAYALAHGLLVLGAIQLAPGGASRTEAALDPGPDDPPEEAAAIDKERALAKHAQVVEGDYFAVLGVARGATTFEIRRAWERARADYAVERFAPAVREELGGVLAEIGEVIDEAWRALSDDGLRQRYRRHLPPEQG